LTSTTSGTGQKGDERGGLFDGDRYPFSPRIRTLKAILAKLRPEPLPPQKVYAPPLGTSEEADARADSEAINRTN
jgi:hypothetical protein